MIFRIFRRPPIDPVHMQSKHIAFIDGERREELRAMCGAPGDPILTDEPKSVTCRICLRILKVKP